jgi:hypothetical protein
MIRTLPWGDDIDGQLAPSKRNARGFISGEAPQGQALLHVRDGWSVISFWDRSGDTRGASNSAFLVRGEHTFDEVAAIAREAFPRIWQRFPFDVVEYDGKAAE